MLSLFVSCIFGILVLGAYVFIIIIIILHCIFLMD
jgi:hypothetical protein